MPTTTCYNPYHFVPVAPRSADQKRDDLKSTDFEKSLTGATTHERYVRDMHSGRLVCRLTTETPVVVGAEQTRQPGQVGEVHPYMAHERPAIPASSLRGLIGSLAEAASNSAARVLTGGAYSYRKPFESKQTLSAIGLVVKKADGKLGLKPVALPTLEASRDPNGRPPGYYIVPPKFRKVFPRPAFKVYAKEVEPIRRNKGFVTAVNGQANYDDMGVPQLKYSVHGGNLQVVNVHPSLHCKPNRDNPRFAVAQDAGGAAPQPGMLRILGCWEEDRDQQIPKGKKHELWLPMPGSDVPTLDLDEAVLAQFHGLADERTAETEEKGPLLPFHPAGTQRNDDPGKWGKRFRLKAGDLVYFDLDENSKVREIALSAIWRGMVKDQAGKGAGAAQFFQAVDPNLVPFSRDRKERTNTITIAERMFGFVEENPRTSDKGAGGGEGGLALASRIRFSDGLLKDGVTAAEALEPSAVTLRILSSPKAPSPALYFKGRTGGRYIRKVDLKPGEHHPQGRKIYLHHAVQPDAKPWETQHQDKNIDQKNRVRPLRRGQEFTFHVDFDNLTDREMGLLLHSMAPDAGFHHKLGMGKPLGLGSVKIEVLEWKVVERTARYTLAGLRSDRYSKIRRPVEAGFWSLRDDAISTGLVSREIHAALRALGNLKEAPATESIHTPTLADQIDPEAETYKWFVANDRTENHFLKTIAENGGAIPALPRPDERSAPPRQGGRR